MSSFLPFLRHEPESSWGEENEIIDLFFYTKKRVKRKTISILVKEVASEHLLSNKIRKYRNFNALIVLMLRNMHNPYFEN